MDFTRVSEDIATEGDVHTADTDGIRERFKRSEDLKLCPMNRNSDGSTLPQFQKPDETNNAYIETSAKLNNTEKEMQNKLLQNEQVVRVNLERNLFNEKNFVCGECFKVFSEPLSLTRHKIYHDKLSSSELFRQPEKDDSKLDSEKQPEKKTIKCDQCSFTFPFMSRLKVHKLTHTNTRTYRCNKCKYTCIRPQALKAHKMVHSGEKPFKCEECGHECRQLSHLKLHLITHISQKPYKCDVCDLTFSFLGELKKHSLTHQGESLIQQD